jgi:hypothetical protein
MAVNVIWNIRKNALAITLVFGLRVNRAFTLPETDVQADRRFFPAFLAASRQPQRQQIVAADRKRLPCNRFYAAIGRPAVCTTGKMRHTPNPAEAVERTWFDRPAKVELTCDTCARDELTRPVNRQQLEICAELCP